MVDREYEKNLVELAASGTLDLESWGGLGPAFFMAGLAVMMASVDSFDRRGLLHLAERLRSGASEPDVFNRRNSRKAFALPPAGHRLSGREGP